MYPSPTNSSLFLSGIAAGTDGQSITLLLYGSYWFLLHAYNSAYCYNCGVAAGFTPKLRTGIKPLLLPEPSSLANYYSSAGWASATFIYDAYVGEGTWILINWSASK